MYGTGRIWAEIDLGNVIANFHAVRELLGDKKILIAIKADAYGHGAAEIASCLEREGADMFGVASVEEGIDLRKNGEISRPILNLSPTPYSEIAGIFDFNICPTITELDFAGLLNKEAARRKKTLSIHVEIDTGMGRTGISLQDALGCMLELNRMKNLKIDGVFTHFPAAGTDLDFTKTQIKRFKTLVMNLKASGIDPKLKHCANSAGFLNFKESYFDMIRPGLIIYGLSPNNTAKDVNLTPVLTLKTRIVNLRKIPRGESISYGRTFFTQCDSLIAVLSVGYGDGYPRALSNKGEVLIDGKKAKIVGTVTMDLTMVDVSDHPSMRIGDEVTLIGNSGKQSISVSDIARLTDTIPYEITSRISPRVPRIFLKQGRLKKIRTLLNKGGAL